MSRQEGNHETIQTNIRKRFAANKAKKKKSSININTKHDLVGLKKIADKSDAIAWLVQYENLDMEELEEQQESEGKEEDDDYIGNLVVEYAKNLGFKDLNGMIGFFDAEHEDWSMPGLAPDSPFDKSGTILLPGFKRQTIPVMSIIDGRLYDAHVNAWVLNNIAFAKRTVYENAVL